MNCFFGDACCRKNYNYKVYNQHLSSVSWSPSLTHTRAMWTFITCNVCFIFHGSAYHAYKYVCFHTHTLMHATSYTYTSQVSHALPTCHALTCIRALTRKHTCLCTQTYTHNPSHVQHASHYHQAKHHHGNIYQHRYRQHLHHDHRPSELPF